MEYIKGDPYIRDMKHTAYVSLIFVVVHSHVIILSRGHVADLSACAWHPKDPRTFITSSADSTIR